MLPKQTPARVERAFQALAPFHQALSKYREFIANAGEDCCDFVFGNPHEMPLPEFVDSLAKVVPPQNKDWYAYKLNELSAQQVVTETLNRQFARPYQPADIFLTNGATGAIQVILNTVVGQGDEVIFLSPPWFFYEGMIRNIGGVPVRVKVDSATFDLDIAAIEAAITDKTRLIIINSPHNPTGKIYPPATLERLAQILTAANEQYGNTIYLLSDEAYRQIIYDGRDFPSPTSYYPHSLMSYTYGKTLLTPGQRLGYVALSPEIAEREQMRMALLSTQILSGFASAGALLQHAIANLEKLSIDIAHLQNKRDRMVSALQDSGYDIHSPEGTFYLLPRSPLPDDIAFVDELAEHGVFCLPGSVAEMPGYFRISLTANDEMIERAIPKFAEVRRNIG